MRVLTDPLGWFTVEVPDDWAVETEDCVTTLLSPSGCGVVYLGGARHVHGRQAAFGGADFLARFLASIGVLVEVAEIGLAPGHGCRIYSYARSGGSTRWRYFSVTDDETALLISSACDTADVGGEGDIVDDLVRSVRLYHSAPVH
jgi:hypothetical protein